MVDAGVEVHDSSGHLHGRKPDPLDPQLHVYIYADTQVNFFPGSLCSS